MGHWNHVEHPDDERFDKIEIVIQPRWKESELSGDEWRFSYAIKGWRKGEVIVSRSFSQLDWALMDLPHVLYIRTEEEGGFDREAYERTKELCDQPGCENLPTVWYKRLKPYTKSGQEIVDRSTRLEYRKFCNKHKHRGDCGLDDSDHNYEDIGQDPRTLGGGR